MKQNCFEYYNFHNIFLHGFEILIKKFPLHLLPITMLQIYIYHFHEVIRNDDSPQPPVENRTLLQRPLALHSQQKPFDDGDHGKQELRWLQWCRILWLQLSPTQPPSSEPSRYSYIINALFDWIYACTCEGFNMANRKPMFGEKHIQHACHKYRNQYIWTWIYNISHACMGIIIYQVYWKNFAVKHWNVKLAFPPSEANQKYMKMKENSRRIPRPLMVTRGRFSHLWLTTGSPYQV